MEKTALILIVITLFFLVLILGLLVLLLYKVFDKKNGLLSQKEGQESAEYHPEVLKRIKEAKFSKVDTVALFCPFHPQEPGEVMCAICDTLFCKLCVKPFKTMHFCKQHLPLVMQNEWEEVLTLKTSTEDPEEGVRLFDQKKEIFLEDKIPSYVETHYKINVDHDNIETYLVVYGMKSDLEILKEKFQNI